MLFLTHFAQEYKKITLLKYIFDQFSFLYLTTVKISQYFINLTHSQKKYLTTKRKCDKGKTGVAHRIQQKEIYF